MPEWLTHVLFAYVLTTGLSWRVEWIDSPYVTVAMIGALVPDLNRLGLLVDGARVEAALGVPFDWSAFHTTGGTGLAILIGAFLVVPSERRRVLAMLCLGGASHHVLDVLLWTPSGYAYPVFWPLSALHPPTPGLFQSTDPWPTVVAIAGAALVAAVARRAHAPATKTVG